MTLKNIRFARAENLSEDIRNEYNLPSEGLIIIESLNPNLRENFIAIGEGGIRDYLLSKGEFLEEIDKTIEVERVSYGRKDTPKELREYKLVGSNGPVGSIKEWELMYPTKKIVIIGGEDE